MDIIEEAHKLGRALAESKEVKRYRQAELQFLNNKKARELYEKYCSADGNGMEAEMFDQNMQAHLVLKEFLEARKALLNLQGSISFIISRATGIQLTTSNCGSCFTNKKCGPCGHDE